MPIFSQNYSAESLTAPIDFSVSSSTSPLNHVIDVLLSRSLPPDIIETEVFNRYQNFKSTYKQKDRSYLGFSLTPTAKPIMS